MPAMSNASAVQGLEYEIESTFGEDVTTFATTRLPIVGGIDLSGVLHAKIDSERTVQTLQDGSQHILGVQEGSFKTKLWLTGHGATTAGSPTVSAMETLKAYVFGTAASNGDLSATASTTLTGGTVAVPTTTASATFSAGGLCAIGAIGDAKGNGQMYPITSHITTSLTLGAAMDGAPAAADVLYPVVQFYLPAVPTNAAATVTGIRFRVMTANLGVELHGCFPMSVTFGGLNPGEIPFMEVTWGLSWWRYTATSGISAVTSLQYNPAPVAAGSMFLNVVGTSTRAKRTFRSFSLTIALGVVPLVGPGGASAYQKIVGAKRTTSKISLKWVEDADAATATPVLDGYFTGTSAYHMMLTLSTTAGSRVGFYFRNLAITGARPMQIADSGINRLAIEAMAFDSTVNTATLLTRAAMVMGYA